MANALKELDDLLRGNSTRPELLARGTAHMRLGPYLALCLALGAVYGLSMGLYAVFGRVPAEYAQLLASALKVPALFLLTLVVVFPSLYTFTALLDVRLDLPSALRLVVAAVTVTLAVLASFAPVTAFFTLSAAGYPFMKVLNVFLFAVAGLIGLGFLARALGRWEAAQAPLAREEAAERNQTALHWSADAGRLRRTASRSGLFMVWMLLYAFVGAQMAWLLRPLIGDPAQPFAVFCERGGNAFADFFNALGKLLGVQ